MIFVVAVLMITALGALAIRGSATEVTSWATCENAKAGYSFKYPSNWFSYGDGSWGHTPIFVRTTPCIGNGIAVQNLHVSEIPAKRVALGVWVRVDEIIPGSANAYSSSSPVMEIDGVSFHLDPFAEGKTYVGEHHGKLYRIAATPLLSEDTFRKILSTFKFME